MGGEEPDQVDTDILNGLGDLIGQMVAHGEKIAQRFSFPTFFLKALHTLSAYATTARLTLAQLSVPEKTNEITAIPDLLDQLAEAAPDRDDVRRRYDAVTVLAGQRASPPPARSRSAVTDPKV